MTSYETEDNTAEAPVAAEPSLTLHETVSSVPPSPRRKKGKGRISHQPSPEKLAKIGIKVRDFAYESTLPPIKMWFPRQYQPDPYSGKSAGSNEEQNPNGSQTKVQRELTEPVIEESSAPRREHCYTNLDQFSESRPSPFNTRPATPSFHTHFPSKHTTDSIAEKPYIATPVVTPNGSLQWSTENSQSQGLDDILPSYPVSHGISRSSLTRLLGQYSHAENNEFSSLSQSSLPIPSTSSSSSQNSLPIPSTSTLEDIPSHINTPSLSSNNTHASQTLHRPRVTVARSQYSLRSRASSSAQTTSRQAYLLRSRTKKAGISSSSMVLVASHSRKRTVGSPSPSPRVIRTKRKRSAS